MANIFTKAVTIALMVLAAAFVAHADSVATIASGAPDLSILVEAVTSTGIVNALTDPLSEITVFAPTNEAFESLLGSLDLVDSDGDGIDFDDIPEDLLFETLNYHVVPAAAASTDLSNGMELPTLAGQVLEVLIGDDGSVSIEGIGSTAEVVQADIQAGAAYVHIISEVLLPFVITVEDDAEPAPEIEIEEGSVADVALNTADLSTLANLAVATGVVGAISDADEVLTVFAPTNEAFEELISVLEAVQGVNATEGFTVEQDVLIEVLANHVIPGEALMASDLEDGQELATLAGENIEVKILPDGTVCLVAEGSMANVTVADVEAGKAIVHIIDSVLLPFELDE